LDLLFISFLRYSQFNLPNCLDQDVDPGIWPYHLFRVDCLVSIYGRSWVGKLFVGEDNRQNRETIIDILNNRNPDWDISRISYFSHVQLLPYLCLVTSMAAKFVFSCSGTKNGSSVFACVDPNNINGIKNFWNQAKRHMRKFNGVPKSHFPPCRQGVWEAIPFS
jgi:hypothetical protein